MAWLTHQPWRMGEIPNGSWPDKSMLQQITIGAYIWLFLPLTSYLGRPARNQFRTYPVTPHITKMSHFRPPSSPDYLSRAAQCLPLLQDTLLH